MITSGTPFRTSVPIQNVSKALIAPGTPSLVIGVIRNSVPALYVCETVEDDQLEIEEFYCYAEQMELKGRVA